MSGWCPTHKKYSGKREPSSLCRLCWSLYLYANPEAKPPLQETYREAEALRAEMEPPS